MRRQEALALFIGMVACPPTLLAQQTGGNFEIPVFAGQSFPGWGSHTAIRRRAPDAPASAAEWGGLRDLGWLPGSNVLIDYRYAEGEPDRLERDAADLVRQNVDLLITRGAAATRAAQLATNSIPIVMAAVPDPIREGFAESLHRPGGNLTGIAFLSTGR